MDEVIVIEILLATYNGEKHLKPLLDSIMQQSMKKWHLTIQDDCSEDFTKHIIKEYVKKYPDKIRLLENNQRFGSATTNFLNMLTKYNSVYPYIMFCDQDDVWLDNKIELSIQKMQEYEQKYDKSTPILIHTDLTVTDENLQTINPSLFHMQKMEYERVKLSHLLVQNVVTGCTVMINQSLFELIRYKIPQRAVMHDWWMAIVTSCFGKIGFVDQSTILYRQHGKNAVGAKNARTFSYKLELLKNVGKFRVSIGKTYIQAEELYNLYGSSLPPKDKKLVKTYMSIPKHTKPVRVITAWRLKSVRAGLWRKLASILYL